MLTCKVTIWEPCHGCLLPLSLWAQSTAEPKEEGLRENGGRTISGKMWVCVQGFGCEWEHNLLCVGQLPYPPFSFRCISFPTENVWVCLFHCGFVSCSFKPILFHGFIPSLSLHSCLLSPPPILCKWFVPSHSLCPPHSFLPPFFHSLFPFLSLPESCPRHCHSTVCRSVWEDVQHHTHSRRRDW